MRVARGILLPDDFDPIRPARYQCPVERMASGLTGYPKASDQNNRSVLTALKQLRNPIADALPFKSNVLCFGSAPPGSPPAYRHERHHEGAYEDDDDEGYHSHRCSWVRLTTCASAAGLVPTQTQPTLPQRRHRSVPPERDSVPIRPIGCMRGLGSEPRRFTPQPATSPAPPATLLPLGAGSTDGYHAPRSPAHPCGNESHTG